MVPSLVCDITMLQDNYFFCYTKNDDDFKFFMKTQKASYKSYEKLVLITSNKWENFVRVRHKGRTQSHVASAFLMWESCWTLIILTCEYQILELYLSTQIF